MERPWMFDKDIVRFPLFFVVCFATTSLFYELTNLSLIAYWRKRINPIYRERLKSFVKKSFDTLIKKYLITQSEYSPSSFSPSLSLTSYRASFFNLFFYPLCCFSLTFFWLRQENIGWTICPNGDLRIDQNIIVTKESHKVRFVISFSFSLSFSLSLPVCLILPYLFVCLLIYFV